MKPIHLATIFSTLMLGSQACKCLVDGRVNAGATKRCCVSLNGAFVNGNDCNAHSISEKLSNFSKCCNHVGLFSDCKFPREAESEGQGEAEESHVDGGFVA
ncbi:hypothetical protein P171DRAFT_509337 [Karstenula rhodostoma CBS 690.94]|uniref:Extracellular membrane protein CFEM domain-containing protein n=1 Tax=Karstenula rhodostoma CBS 690.94 TaxID=1392251 RepID=A0A9P4PRN3_9PLEO|nr:hypothetical protein P171DRAFT_509337 [Karstenula rhodostoma CBS 690.94]